MIAAEPVMFLILAMGGSRLMGSVDRWVKLSYGLNIRSGTCVAEAAFLALDDHKPEAAPASCNVRSLD